MRKRMIKFKIFPNKYAELNVITYGVMYPDKTNKDPLTGTMPYIVVLRCMGTFDTFSGLSDEKQVKNALQHLYCEEYYEIKYN